MKKRIVILVVMAFLLSCIGTFCGLAYREGLIAIERPESDHSNTLQVSTGETTEQEAPGHSIPVVMSTPRYQISIE